MLRPAENNVARNQQVAKVRSKPAPIGGWNARDPVSDMDEKDAIYLDNMFPNSTSVQLRNGSTRFAYGIGKISAFTRASSATYFDINNVLVTVGNNIPRFAQIAPYAWMNPPPLIVEAAATNYLLRSRDMSNAAWVKTNMTGAKDQVGLDSVVAAASSMLATAANATILQAVTMPTGGVFTGYVKRLIGAGTLEVTVNNGANWTAIAGTTTGAWTKFTLAGALINPTIGFRIGTNGDKFAFDLGQAEVGAAGTSYIATVAATVARSADVPTYLAGASATVNPAPVETLIEYSFGNARNLLAGCNGAFFDITAGGVIGLPLATGFLSNRWQYVNQGGYACMFNGSDTPQSYNGSVIAALVITGSGLTPSNLNYPCVYGGRVFAVERNSLNVWYGGIGAIQGAFSKLDFSGFFKHGGKIVACGTWSRDGGSGANEYIVFVTNMGEVLVYNGDPALAATWSKVGLFRTSPPIGNRPLVKISQDMVMITTSGFLPLSMVLPIDRVGDDRFAVSDKIRNAVNMASRAYGTLFGWEALVYPTGTMVLFNVPTTEDAVADQYVVNTVTAAWCRFRGLNAITWALSNERCYFGSANGYVVQFDTPTGGDDALTTYTGTQQLSALQWDIKTAQNYFGTRTQEKQFKMVRPVIGASGKPIINVALNMDFDDKYPTSTITVGGGGSQWDVSFWDVAQWDSGIQIRKSWLNAPGTGYSASLRLRGQTTALNVVLYSIDYAFENGGVL